MPSVGFYSLQKKEDFIILGETVEKKKITLVAYHMISHQGSLGTLEPSTTVFNIKFIIQRIHFDKVEDIQFESVFVEYSSISNWLHFDFEDKWLSVRIGEKRIAGSRYHKPIEVKIDNFCSIQILLSAEVNWKTKYEPSRVCNCTSGDIFQSRGHVIDYMYIVASLEDSYFFGTTAILGV